MMTVTHVSRVGELHPTPGFTGVTAIDKRPVEGQVAVHRLGVHGDVQADRTHHGGPDKAVYAFSQDMAVAWAAILGRGVPAGWFGENLRVEGPPVEDAEFGERWRIGTVELEVTGPRSPCATFARWVARPTLVQEVIESGRPGVYFRVVTAGTLAAGDPVEVVDRPGHGVTIGAWFRERPADLSRALLDAEDDAWQLAPYMRKYVEASARRIPLENDAPGRS